MSVVMSSQQDFLAELECPVCNEYMRPPIRMCEVGHSICNICQSKTKNCPQCKSKFTNARNFSLERMSGKVEVRCKNSVYGCKYKNKAEKIEDHEMNKCWFIPRTCPMSLSGKCNTKTSVHAVIDHLHQQHYRDVHTTNVYGERNSCMISLFSFVSNIFSDDSKNHELFIANINNDFFVIKATKVSKFVKWNVYFGGLPHIAADYDYKIKIKYRSPDSNRGHTIGGPCEPAFNGNVEYSEENSVQISINLVNECLSSRGSLFFTIKVTEYINS